MRLPCFLLATSLTNTCFSQWFALEGRAFKRKLTVPHCGCHYTAIGWLLLWTSLFAGRTLHISWTNTYGGTTRLSRQIPKCVFLRHVCASFQTTISTKIAAHGWYLPNRMILMHPLKRQQETDTRWKSWQHEHYSFFAFSTSTRKTQGSEHKASCSCLVVSPCYSLTANNSFVLAKNGGQFVGKHVT